MSRVFVTGDTHGGSEGGRKKLESKKWPVGKTLTQDDYLIVAGDFGGVWFQPGTYNHKKRDLPFQKFLTEQKPWTTLFIDGNHCFSKDTEVLTELGWLSFEGVIDLEIKIAEYCRDTKTILFSKPLGKIKCDSHSMVKFDSARVRALVSPNHRMLYKDELVPASHFLSMGHIPSDNFTLYGNSNYSDLDLSDDELRLLVNVVMDATIIDFNKRNSNSKKCTIQFKLSKERKITHLLDLLSKMNIPYSYKPATKSGLNKLQPYYIRVYSDAARGIWYELLQREKCLPSSFRYLSKRQLLVVLDELAITDGSRKKCSTLALVWTTTSSKDADIIQEACVVNNLLNTRGVHNNEHGLGSKQQHVSTIYDKGYSAGKEVSASLVEYRDKTYCYSMPLGTLVTRYKGSVTIQGNENHYLLANLEQVPMFGGVVGKVSDHLYHLKRGEIYTINNKKYFVMGGAKSYDKESRTIGIDWWEEEMPSFAEMDYGLENLEKHNWEVDYVITHNCPEYVAAMFMSQNNANNHYDYKFQDPTTSYLEHIRENLKFKEWYFGHWHKNWSWENFHMLYHKIVEIK